MHLIHITKFSEMRDANRVRNERFAVNKSFDTVLTQRSDGMDESRMTMSDASGQRARSGPTLVWTVCLNVTMGIIDR